MNIISILGYATMFQKIYVYIRSRARTRIYSYFIHVLYCVFLKVWQATTTIQARLWCVCGLIDKEIRKWNPKERKFSTICGNFCAQQCNTDFIRYKLNPIFSDRNYIQFLELNKASTYLSYFGSNCKNFNFTLSNSLVSS